MFKNKNIYNSIILKFSIIYDLDLDQMGLTNGICIIIE